MPQSTSGVKFRLTPGTDYLTAYRDEDLRGNLRNLYPFLDDGFDELFDPDNLLYGPNADPSPGYLQHDLRVSLLTPVSSFGLGADVVPGSVQVLRNGVAENRFEFDAAVGVVSFLTEIAPDDRLDHQLPAQAEPGRQRGPAVRLGQHHPPGRCPHPAGGQRAALERGPGHLH